MAFFKLLSIAGLASLATAWNPSNPLKVASAVLLGDRLPTNDQSIRDLGYQSSIGSTWLNTFGDGVGCKVAATQDTCGPGCAFLSARDGAAVQGDNPLEFADLNVRADLCGGVPQIGSFCPILPGETAASGLGITNVVEVNSSYGLLLTRPTFSANLSTPGAGLAVVDVSSGTPVCTRPFGISSWGPDEPNWGQLSSLVMDGYIYTYANGPNFNTTYSSVVLARVPQAKAFDVHSYEYYHGHGHFSPRRIYLSKLKANSPELLIGATSPQGQVVFSPYYQKYIMFGTYIAYVYATAAEKPWGPWSAPITVYTPASQRSFIYAPHILQKFVADSGKWFLLSYSDSNTLPVVNITWA